jgi:hypothetical protein
MLRGSHQHKPHMTATVVAGREKLSPCTDNFVFLRVLLVMHYPVDAGSRYFAPRCKDVVHLASLLCADYIGHSARRAWA